ncbi:alpha/beta hydrolase [Cellulomonas fimi]|uniref:Alpha/beta hydrolase n=1 Tax=Cellulomonas fimi TaxID=1708 RepID=A0A7Y0QG48_CELFI|nr:alpha/beta hydrolase [Cellulomonas fimi]NMR19741.1 alpha/beta hydrolase [Cellulomonas fimi]
MHTSRRFRALVATLAAAAVIGSVVAAPAAAGGTASGGTAGTPGAARAAAPQQYPGERAEARRVDRVPTPQPSWFDCSPAFGPGNECTTVNLPLDYDRPQGPTTAVAVLRHSATDQANRIGTLFLNPGGPGGSGVQIAAAAGFFLGPEVLARFDVVGFDPRGTNFSDNVRCWENLGTQAADLAGLGVPFPFTDAEETAYVASSEAFGRACSTTGRPLSASMSTAEVARDMDVLRRMVGDQQLTYLGFSYGSYLGNVYANLFPSRVRAVAIDGVLDPLAWAGTRADRDVPQTARLRSGEAAARALDEILRRCAEAGPELCTLAALGDPRAIYAEIRAALQETPLPIVDPVTGEELFTLTYPTLVSFLLGDMYFPEAALFVDADLSFAYSLLHPPTEPGSADPGSAMPSQDVARAALLAKVRDAEAQAAAARATHAEQAAALGFAFPYDNSPEAFQSVLCTDGSNPARADRWRGYADEADLRAPDFGRLWTWSSAPCASATWKVRDEDAYRGPFTRSTVNPVLVVGNYWDPATSYDGAVTAASLLPNSRLLSSDSWGHTAYGTSACVTDAVDAYLLSVQTPAEGTLCVGDVQPFSTSLGEEPGPDSRARGAQPDRLPPVVPPLPGAVPRG